LNSGVRALIPALESRAIDTVARGSITIAGIAAQTAAGAGAMVTITSAPVDMAAIIGAGEARGRDPDFFGAERDNLGSAEGSFSSTRLRRAAAD